MDDIMLYHGSRAGIKGNITFNHPLMGTNRDFGKGFYMGTNPLQAKTLIINGQSPTFYELNLRLSNIPEKRILKLDGMKWAYFVLCNRKKLKEINPQIVHSEFYRYFYNLSQGKDLIIGTIADDKMYNAMENFAEDLITDTTLLETMSEMNYGTQYVAKTQYACDQIEILNYHKLTKDEINELTNIAQDNREKSIEIYRKNIKKHSQGNYLSYILKEQIWKTLQKEKMQEIKLR